MADEEAAAAQPPAEEQEQEAEDQGEDEQPAEEESEPQAEQNDEDGDEGDDEHEEGEEEAKDEEDEAENNDEEEGQEVSETHEPSVNFSTAASDAHLIPEDDDDDDDNEKKKKGGGGIGGKIISGMWATRQMLDSNTDPQLYVKITLRELILYCIFMCVISYQTYAQFNPLYFTYTDMMKSLFSKQLDVTNMDLFWQFCEEDLLDGLYWETWYNKGEDKTDLRCPDGSLATKPCPVPPADRNVMYENRMLGLPRLRQLRVTNSSCDIHPDFANAIKECYNEYAQDNEDSTHFPPNIRSFSSESAWTYHTEEALGGTSHWGQIATYSGAGYHQTLHYLKDTSLKIIRELKEGLWVTQGTRFVTIDFTVYNVNINLFCIVKLTFEFPATGGVIPDQQFSTVKLLKYTTSWDFVLLCCEVLFALFIMYYIIEESLEIKARKMAYFFNLANLLDLVVIGISVAQIIYSLINTFIIDSLIQVNIDKPFEYTDFSGLAGKSRTLITLMAFNVFAAWIKLFKYLSWNKTMTQLSQTLTSAAKDLSGFSVMFCIIYSAFVQLGYLLFGTQVRDFRTFMDALLTLFRMILGDFNFRDIEKANTILGPIFFLSYIFFVFFVLLNMFLAIINDTYGEVKAELKQRKPDFQMGDFFKTGANNVKSWMGIQDRAVDVENAIKIAASDDGFVTYEELRENLRKARFADAEIDIFFEHFKKDPIISQIILDEEEIKSRERAAERRRLSSVFGADGDDADDGFVDDEEEDEEGKLRPRSGWEARRMRSARIKSGRDPEPRDMVADSDFYSLQTRVSTMEASIAPLATSIDAVLARLGLETAGERKITKKEIASMFDQMMKADEDDKVKCEKMAEFVETYMDGSGNGSRRMSMAPPKQD